MTYQVPPCRPSRAGIPPAQKLPTLQVADPAKDARQPFVPVSFVEATGRPKRPHWAVAAVLIVVKTFFFCFCVLLGFTTFCVAFHQLARWG